MRCGFPPFWNFPFSLCPNDTETAPSTRFELVRCLGNHSGLLACVSKERQVICPTPPAQRQLGHIVARPLDTFGRTLTNLRPISELHTCIPVYIDTSPLQTTVTKPTISVLADLISHQVSSTETEGTAG